MILHVLQEGCEFANDTLVHHTIFASNPIYENTYQYDILKKEREGIIDEKG